MSKEVIDIKIRYERKERETLQHAKARLQQELINKGYSIAGDTVTKKKSKKE